MGRSVIRIGDSGQVTRKHVGECHAERRRIQRLTESEAEDESSTEKSGCEGNEEKMSSKKRQLVFVTWFDALYQRGELTEDELVTRVEMESGGLLVREDKETISIALDYYDGAWRHVSHIPKVNVKKIKRFKLPG